MKSSNSPGNSLLSGVDEVIDRWLGFPDSDRYRKSGKVRKKDRAMYSIKRAAQDLSKRNERFASLGGNVLEDLYRVIEANWNTGRCHQPTGVTWRLGKETKGGRSARKQEVGLERFIVRTLGEHWTNQLPTCAGEGARSIDLVCDKGEQRYEFIELKYGDGRGRTGFGADNPLHAAWEIVRYGLLYIHARENNLLRGGGLAEAKHISLKVLAPAEYYEYGSKASRKKYNFGWLEEALNQSFLHLCGERGYGVTFAFEMFCPEFSRIYDPLSSPPADEADFRSIDLSCRSRVYPPG
jgi:hypothetical protein